MTPGRAAIVWLLSRYLAPGESASQLEVQKLSYFLQEAGEALKLPFSKQRYGPYADSVRHAVLAMEGHFVQGFGDGTGVALSVCSRVWRRRLRPIWPSTRKRSPGTTESPR